jgi:hypothetical protein
LRYFDALETNHLELEIEDAPFAINAWSKLAIDAVGALDAQEYDTTTFGAMQVCIFLCVCICVIHSVFSDFNIMYLPYFLICVCEFMKQYSSRMSTNRNLLQGWPFLVALMVLMLG